jgi:uncharacterized protein (DUF486 family)
VQRKHTEEQVGWSWLAFFLVRPSQEPGIPTMVRRGARELGIALFEYMLQVPANRIGYTTMTLGQLKILQEVITLSVFVPFAYYYMHQPLKMDYLWAALCIMGAVFCVFRGH